MKKFTFILCMLLVLSLCGCGLFPEAAEPTAPETMVETKYYTVTLPDSWGESCIYEVFPADEEGPDALVLYEKESHNTKYGGHLCTILLIPHGEDYSYYPSYEWIGVLETPEGDMDIVVLYPTDVQFSEETAAAYNEMVQDVEDVIISLKAKDGIGMMLP